MSSSTKVYQGIVVGISLALLTQGIRDEGVAIGGRNTHLVANCDFAPLELVPPFECGREGACDIARTCEPFRGMPAKCIYQMSNLEPNLLLKAKQWAALCLGSTNLHEKDNKGNSKLSMVADKKDENYDGFGVWMSQENADLQKEYGRPNITTWWAALHHPLNEFGGPQTIETCNNRMVARGGKRKVGTWACQSDIQWINPDVFQHAHYVTHHYLNYLTRNSPTSSPDLEKRILQGLYIQHMHTRLLDLPAPSSSLPKNVNKYDARLVTDCSKLPNGRAPSTCRFGEQVFGAPYFFWGDDTGAWWSTAVGACFGTDPVTQHWDVCGLSDDETLLRDVASTVIAYFHSQAEIPMYGARDAAHWTRAIDVCIDLDCRKTSDAVAKLSDDAIELIAKMNAMGQSA